MSYGGGAWGGGGWGVGEDVPPPSIMAVGTIDGVTAKLDRLGGTVMVILGDNFVKPVTVELLTGALGAYTVVGNCYIAIERYDVSLNRIYAGAPAMPSDGVLDTDAATGTRYHVRVTTVGGEAVLEDAVFFRQFADEMKILQGRSAWARVWRVGRRILLGG